MLNLLEGDIRLLLFHGPVELAQVDVATAIDIHVLERQPQLGVLPYGFGFRVSGFGFRVSGVEFRV
jgi:hypothetical protein